MVLLHCKNLKAKLRIFDKLDKILSGRFLANSENTVFDRMSARGADVILGARGEALILKRSFRSRGRSLNIFHKT